MFKRIVLSFLSTILLGALTGCNTIEGAGKDIEKAGTVIKNEAKEVKKKM